jgi:ribosomal protein L37AE/L43A
MKPMSKILPKPTERLRAAFRILTKRGDDAIVCSFCGSGRHDRSHIIAGPGVSICWDCARIAANCAYDSTMQPVTGERGWITIAPILAPGEKLTSSRRGSLHETLTQQAVAHGCELLSWHYACGHEVAGDYLGFSVTSANDVEAGPLQQALKASCRRALALPEIESNAR